VLRCLHPLDALDLRRLDGIVAGRAAQLVDDLSTGAIFYKGGLARRLTELDLPSLDESEQRRVGSLWDSEQLEVR